MDACCATRSWPFTWFRVGGPAELIFLPEDEDDLAAFLKGLDPGSE